MRPRDELAVITAGSVIAELFRLIRPSDGATVGEYTSSPASTPGLMVPVNAEAALDFYDPEFPDQLNTLRWGAVAASQSSVGLYSQADPAGEVGAHGGVYALGLSTADPDGPGGAAVLTSSGRNGVADAGRASVLAGSGESGNSGVVLTSRTLDAPGSATLSLFSTRSTGLGELLATGLGWQTPALAAGLANVAAPNRIMRYRRLLDCVQIGGIIQNVSGAAYGPGFSIFAAVLPVAYRPVEQVHAAAVGLTAGLVDFACRVEVSPAGSVFNGTAIPNLGYFGFQLVYPLTP